MLDGKALALRAQEAEIWSSEEDRPSAMRSQPNGATIDRVGEDAAFNALVERQSRFVFKVAYAMLRNPEDAEDVVQETFMKLYRTGAWRDIRDERGFLARTTWRVALDHISGRKNDAKATCALTGPQDESDAERHDLQMAKLPSLAAGPEQAAVQSDWHATVHRLIDALPEELRQPLALTSVEGLTSREISVVLGISEGTVRTRLMRARQVLRQKLAAFTEARHAK
ncbi:MAG TPA: sigma-70 family RNA polymerase sigma factor [Acidisarcina sp.]